MNDGTVNGKIYHYHYRYLFFEKVAFFSITLIIKQILRILL
jgi:hypothetical protein